MCYNALISTETLILQLPVKDRINWNIARIDELLYCNECTEYFMHVK